MQRHVENGRECHQRKGGPLCQGEAEEGEEDKEGDTNGKEERKKEKEEVIDYGMRKRNNEMEAGNEFSPKAVSTP